MLRLLTVLSIAVLSGCATAYQSSGATGGFVEKHLEDDVYKMYFGGNGYTTRDTVQTYWLYRCADFALQKGYDGFKILSPIQLSMVLDKLPAASRDQSVRKASMIFIPVDSGPKPSIEADVQFLKGEIDHQPPKVFDAELLREQLHPLVFGKKCEMENVCPHVKKYLYGDEMDESI